MTFFYLRFNLNEVSIEAMNGGVRVHVSNEEPIQMKAIDTNVLFLIVEINA
ncbi:hypothetical protein EPICR_30251 [Candidatus Desulfarcum epimagneticum]|uniref:Uncharacterized protein n=1 Tax=uncultured Desulfobacteraceae bacterium TaxID=218296 RepID=A0A484HL38_9BACT|nr:hypothetical protein EPICR_30251 [uncultured Desulfobacteraceae bacterium]